MSGAIKGSGTVDLGGWITPDMRERARLLLDLEARPIIASAAIGPPHGMVRSVVVSRRRESVMLCER